MKKLCLAVIATSLMLVTSLVNATVIEFEAFKIRNNDGSIDAPWDANLTIVENADGDGFSGMTPLAGQKIGYGSSAFDGMQANLLDSINFLIDPGSVAGKIPYLNLWLTDGINYAILALGGDFRGNDLNNATQNWLLYEYYTDASVSGIEWLFGAGYSLNGHEVKDGANNPLKLADLSDSIVLADPGNPYPGYVGTGAPRGGFGLNIIFGDTQANYLGGMAISDLTIGFDGKTYEAGNAVPEPGAFALFSLGCVLLLRLGRKATA